MIAIILNSGVGSRMGGLTADNPKCMVELAPGSTILSMQIGLLMEAGIRKFAITTGYLADRLTEHAKSCCPGADIDFIHNSRYSETNYIVSLYNTIGRTQDDILMLHGDLVFSAAALGKALNAQGSVVSVDRAAQIPEKDFKARLAEGGRVLEIGVNTFGPGCVACQPLYKLCKDDWLRWQRAIADFCDSGDVLVYAENALNTITNDIMLFGLDMDGELCMEIDNRDDLAVAQSKLGLRGNR